MFNINFHLILTIKYRRSVITDEISDELLSHFKRIGERYNITVEEWGHDKDHIHVLFSSHPNTDISKFINTYKSASSRLIKRDFPEIKRQLWKEYFWSRSFCLISTGDAPLDVIRKYIESQGEKK